jgi:hypothetical protein
MTEDYRNLPEYMALDTALDHLARLRDDLEQKQAVLDALRAELMPYEKAVRDAKEAERVAYDMAVQAVLAIKDAHGDLTPIPGEVTIARVQKATYDKQALAQWALEHGRLDLLKIEVREAEVASQLRDGEAIEGATLVEEFRPRIAQKLGHRVLVSEEK